MLFGSTRELSSTWSVGQFDYGATPIQTSSFSCTEPNAYITNTLNKLFFLPRVLHVFFICHAYTACFDLLEQNGGKSTKICFPLASRTRNITCLMCINTSVCGACFVFENDKSVAG